MLYEVITAAAHRPGGTRQPRGPGKDLLQSCLQEGEGNVPRAGDERFRLAADSSERKERNNFV